MPVDPPGLLKLLGAVAWTCAYLLIVRRGFVDRALGIPAVAVACNLAVEAAYALPLAPRAPRHFAAVYAIWLALDLAIAWQVLVYGPSRWQRFIPPRWFPWAFAGATGLAFLAVLGTAVMFDDRDGRWSAYVSNVLMSGLFVTMLRREGVAGQSLPIAWAKLVGTLAFTVMLAGWGGGQPGVIALGCACLVLDLYYANRLERHLTALGLQPWRRW